MINESYIFFSSASSQFASFCFAVAGFRSMLLVVKQENEPKSFKVFSIFSAIKKSQFTVDV